MSDALYDEARLAFDAGELEVAERLLRRSLEVQSHFKTHHVLSQVLAMQGREVESRKELATAFVLNPNNDRVATDHALALGAEGQGAEARAVLRSVLRRNTTYGPAKAALDEIDRAE